MRGHISLVFGRKTCPSPCSFRMHVFSHFRGKSLAQHPHTHAPRLIRFPADNTPPHHVTHSTTTHPPHPNHSDNIPTLKLVHYELPHNKRCLSHSIKSV